MPDSKLRIRILSHIEVGHLKSLLLMLYLLAGMYAYAVAAPGGYDAESNDSVSGTQPAMSSVSEDVNPALGNKVKGEKASRRLPYEVHASFPTKTVAYVIGDTVEMVLDIKLNQPYRLAPGSVPLRGLQQNGIELKSAQLKEVNNNQHDAREFTQYRLALTYQLFTSAGGVIKTHLPRHVLKFTGPGQAFNYTTPLFQLRISPLATAGESYVERDMSPYRGPMLVKPGPARWWLAVFLLLLLASLAGLAYINTDGSWFPGMGGPFAMAHRNINQMTSTQMTGNQQNAIAAVQQLHAAFNATYGENLFREHLDSFLAKHPNFDAVRQQIEHFFDRSDEVLFAVESGKQADKLLAFLSGFSEQCRHCERKLL